MVNVQKSIIINRPQQTIFDYVHDLANAPRWQNQVVSVEWTSESPHGIGSTQRTVARVMGREMETTSEITIWDPPNQHGFKAESGPFQIQGGMTFEPHGDNTKVTMRGEANGKGLFKFVEGLVKKQMNSEFAANLEALKLQLETD